MKRLSMVKTVRRQRAALPENPTDRRCELSDDTAGRAGEASLDTDLSYSEPALHSPEQNAGPASRLARSNSLNVFFSGMQPDARLPVADPAGDDVRARYVAFIQANFDYERLVHVASFMAMELQVFGAAIDDLVQAQQQSANVVTAAIAETNEGLDTYRGDVAKLIDEGLSAGVRVGVKAGIKEGKKQIAGAGGRANAERSNQIRTYAISLFDAGSWKSTRMAAAELWPKVFAESERLNRRMSADRGPQTLYEWLLEHKKNTR